MEGQNTFGEFLRNYRTERNLSTNDVHVKTGVSQPYLSQIENGKKPSIKIVKKISEGLKVNENYLMRLAGYIIEEDVNNLFSELTTKRKLMEEYSKQYSATFEEFKKMTSMFNQLSKKESNIEEIKNLLQLIDLAEKKLRKYNDSIEALKLETASISKQIDTSINELGESQMNEFISDVLDSVSSVDLLEVLSSDIEITFGEKTLTDLEKKKMLSVLNILFDN